MDEIEILRQQTSDMIDALVAQRAQHRAELAGRDAQLAEALSLLNTYHPSSSVPQPALRAILTRDLEG